MLSSVIRLLHSTAITQFRAVVILAVSVSVCFGTECQRPSTCDVDVPCDCCQSDKCHPDSDLCSTEFCKNGHWGGKCVLSCPQECECCDRNFGITNTCPICVAGHYGTDCSSYCSEGCKSCEKTTGSCLECNHGYYGDKSCNMSCSANCQNASCDINTGACHSCKNGFYGTFCNQSCPPNCTNGICDKVNGQCTSCNTGYYGPFCYDLCPDNCFSNLCAKVQGNCFAGCANGYHGLKCDISCPISCNNSICSMYYGNCTQGCVPNFEGNYCERCVTGKYGAVCAQPCSENCLHNKCRREDGVCANGCKPVFSDAQFCCLNNMNCEKCANYSACANCTSGTYGDVCEDICSGNCNGACDKSTGHCFQCYLNHYGSECEHCSVNCIETNNGNSVCHETNGSCILGCGTGYFGHKCDTECSPGCNDTCVRETGECDRCKDNTFGTYCEQDCPTHCLQHGDTLHLCLRENGTCKFGCESGFYGNQCDKRCPVFCNVTCHRETRQCDRGCVINHFGSYCENTCSVGCAEGQLGTSRCYATNGTCMFGCLDGEKCSSSLSGDDRDFPITAVVAAAVSAITVVVVAVVIFIVIRKRTKSHTGNNDSDKQMLGPKYENTVFDGAHHFEEEELDEGPPLPVTNVVEENPYYSNAKRPHTKLSKGNLKEILSKSHEDYKQEFEFLPSGLIKPYTDATKSGNAHKNRYKRIYPYDDSRVKVAGTDSDYINASYIHGYKKKRAYIAAQGPTTKNLGADFAMFWKMVWQEKVETVVMVTKLHEISGSKCDQYWPNVDTASTYAEFAVHCAKEEVFTEFVVRSLTITKGKEKRHLNHVNFTAWPDKGVPNDVISIINLRHKVDKMRKMFDGPLLVHCSAGIGRTGTYIALDILTRQGYAEDHIDVFECVVDMRQHRPSMVQTQEQYQFLHHAVLWTLTADIAPLPADSFIDLSWLDHSQLAEMSNQLQLSNFYDNAEEMTAINDNKRIPFSNRKGADIPGRRHGVSLVKNEMANKSSYINAVYLDSYKTKDRFIAAMTPLPDTVTDFLGMLLQEEVTCIVDLTPSDSDQEDIGEYLPADNQTVEYESHVFTISAREARDCFVKREIVLSNKSKKKGGDRRTIHHYQFTRWDAGAALPSSADFVTLVNAVDTATIKMQLTGPIVVHCLTGAVRSGLFCAVWLLIERMQIDNEVSVLNTLRQVKTRRRGAIPDKEQIAFCFECVDHHLRYLSERVYSNTELKPGGQ